MVNTKVAFINMQIFMSKLYQNVPYLLKNQITMHKQKREQSTNEVNWQSLPGKEALNLVDHLDWAILGQWAPPKQ